MKMSLLSQVKILAKFNSFISIRRISLAAMVLRQSSCSRLGSKGQHPSLFRRSKIDCYKRFRNEQYPHAFCDTSYLVAFGALNEIVICTMQPIQEIYKFERPSFCKERSLPYIDWGYGLTPGKRDKTVPIMAFAWDRVV
jgi:hypothetical protein